MRNDDSEGEAGDQREDKPSHAIVMASSTGGPRALMEFLEQFDRACAWPIVIVQHIQAAVVRMLATSLSQSAARPIAVATHGARVRRGEIWLAPGNFHTRLLRTPDAGLEIALDQEAPIHSCRPAADALFMSAAVALGPAAVGVVLTGLGCDGTAGSAAIVAAGGMVFAQTVDSCVAPGMPQSVIGAGLSSYVGTPAALAAHCAALHRKRARRAAAFGSPQPSRDYEKP